MMTLHLSEEEPDWVQSYHPEFGHPLENGNLLIPVAGRTADGEIVDGRIEVAPDHPNYREWLHSIENKDEIIRARHEQTKRERDERRRHSVSVKKKEA